MYYVYIIESLKNGQYYIGSTGNLDDRLKRHNNGENKSSRPFAPYKLVYKEKYNSFAEARKRESYIKRRKSRKFVEELVSVD